MGEGDLFLFFEGEQMCERVCLFWLKEKKVRQVETECSHRFYCINILHTVHRYTDTKCKYDINIGIWRVRPLFGILFPSPLNFQWSMGMCLGSLERHQPWAEIGPLQSPPAGRFAKFVLEVFLGGVSYDKMEDGGTSVVTFMPPGVFQMETKMPFGITQIKLISDKNATCKIKGKNYKLYLGWPRERGGGLTSKIEN